MGRTKRSKSGTKRKKKPSKYSGKGLDNELREALGGKGAQLEGKTNDDLFFTSKTPDSAPSRRQQIRKKYLDKKRKRELIGKVIPKISKHEEKKIGKIQSNIESNAADKLETPTSSDDVFDIWADGVPKNKKRNVSKSRFDPVKVCHPGGSYNPSKKDHTEGLQELVAKEQVRRSKMHSKLTQIFREYEKSVSDDEEEKEEEKEEEEEVEEKEEDEEPEKVESKVVTNKEKNERVTRTQRNKQKRLAKAEKEREKKLKEKQFNIELHNIGSIAKSVRRDQARKSESIKRKRRLLAAKAAAAEPVIKVNGKIVPQATPIEVVLPSQLSDNMRRLVPHGGVVSDRFKSMQSRNLIETGNMNRQRRKAKGRKNWRTKGEAFIK
mmetsp:Transcript_14356/g.16792  ORF Transcript_14356/g.16792 Transcript_14356/m.16792 type:complete len:380 (-) Transcript_14356:110-1249(-)|eukprot:CAMPEP_0184042426 /NCGR_PEP_ID=MMETSP0955-20130417/66341_1 /TAXON_ID=627963 /ORGANISM="Aplanochytrium sp, Strain PBS07" /LENGTH=379 /DNA_ID=CAMNT_0026333185 /DNA_START=476 /DNA_END=1615 /DNA_ORIENTATION=-